jgi:protein SCO1/2
MLFCLALTLFWLVATPRPLQAGDASDFAFAQNRGAAVPADASFTEADGRAVRLGDLLGTKPLILALGYFHCPSLCSIVRDDLLETLSHTAMRTGVDYDLVFVSIDSAETLADAADAYKADKARYPMAGADTGWHFLVGDAGSVAALAQAVGFKSRYDIHLKQFLHPAGVVVLTPGGRVSGYILGVGYHAGDLRTAVTLASSNGIAKAALPLLLLCFHYDAVTGRYSLEIVKIMRLAGVATVMTIGSVVLLALWRERHQS